MGEARARELIYAIGAENFRDRVLLAWSRSQESAHDEAWRALATLPQRWSTPVFPLRAADFIAHGVEKGPSLGAALAQPVRSLRQAGTGSEAASLERLSWRTSAEDAAAMSR